VTEIDIQARKCPVCDSVANTLLYRQKFAQFAQGGLLSGYDIVTCNNCGFGYADHIPPQSWFDAYYRDLSKYEYPQRAGEESQCDRERYVHMSQYLAPFITPESNILDFGCATAGLLHELKQRGFGRVTGIDPSPTCSLAARKLYDINVLTTDLSTAHVPDKSYDLIILTGVLEHIVNVRSALQKMHGWLVKDGIIFVDVPDATAFSDWPDAPYQAFSTEHINFFSRSSLAAAMLRNGFGVVDQREVDRYYTRGTIMPSTIGIYRKVEVRVNATIPDMETQPCLLEYIRLSAQRENRIKLAIEAIVSSGEEIIVWGVGTHTLHLMETTNLTDANIVAFVDSNTNYQGNSLKGVPIISPQMLTQHKQPILISSRVFQTEIQDQIRNHLNLPNEIICLYDDIEGVEPR